MDADDTMIIIGKADCLYRRAQLETRFDRIAAAGQRAT